MYAKPKADCSCCLSFANRLFAYGRCLTVKTDSSLVGTTVCQQVGMLYKSPSLAIPPLFPALSGAGATSSIFFFLISSISLPHLHYPGTHHCPSLPHHQSYNPPHSSAACLSQPLHQTHFTSFPLPRRHLADVGITTGWSKIYRKCIGVPRCYLRLLTALGGYVSRWVLDLGG